MELFSIECRKCNYDIIFDWEEKEHILLYFDIKVELGVFGAWFFEYVARFFGPLSVLIPHTKLFSAFVVVDVCVEVLE